MTASGFINHVETTYGVSIVALGATIRLIGADRLPQHVRSAVSAHRLQILTWLNAKEDAQLRFTQSRVDRTRLGLVELENGRWTHPEGDSAMDEVLAGLVDAAEAERQALARRERVNNESFAMTRHV